MQRTQASKATSKSKGNSNLAQMPPKPKPKKKHPKPKGKPKPRRASAMTLLEQAEAEIQLSQAHQREMEVRDLFARLDADRSGFIDRTELKPLLVQMGFNETTCTPTGFDRFLQEEFSRSDTSGDDMIDFGEFCTLYNRLVDSKDNITYLNRAIALIDGNSTLTSQGYLEQVERLAKAHSAMDKMSIDIIAKLNSLGDKPTPEVLQVFTCILILYGVKERETPEEDWEAAKHMFDSPNFVEDLRTFDHSKLRRKMVARCIQRSQPLVNEFKSLEKKQPLTYSLLCWVLITIAKASKEGILDQIDAEEATPIAKRQSFLFTLGTNARKGVFRILDSDLFTGDFHRKRDPTSNGITLQVGTLETNFKEAIAAIYFDRKKFTEEQAGEWWTSHKESKQFETALEAMMNTPRVDVSSFDFSTGEINSNNKKGKKGTAAADDTVEQWGYNEAGDFVMTLVSKSEQAATASDELVAPIKEALSTLTTELFVQFGELTEDPGHGEPAICVVALLLGALKPPENWMDAKMWMLNPNLLNSMRAMDVRTTSRLTLHKRLREVNKYFLDPTLSTANLKDGHPVVYAFVRWAKAIVLIAEHPDIVQVGRQVDSNKL